MEKSADDRAFPAAHSAGGEEVFAFGGFQMFPSRRLLLEGGDRLPIGSRAFDVLVTLIRAAGSVVSKEDLLAWAWPGVYVQEGSLRVQIAGLRKLLRDGKDGRRFIVNNAGRGYSFAAPVSVQVYGEAQTNRGLPQAVGDALPAVLTKVFGREAFIELLTTELPEHRFITIVGPGGIGKTTAALMVAAAMRRDCRDGALFVDLAPINDSALVPSIVSLALGLPVKSRDPIPDLIASLRNKQLLLVIDNCEHVIGAAATLVESILSRAAQVQILATSREPLSAQGERVHRLDPLKVPPKNMGLTTKDAMEFSAVQLFVDRTRAALGMFELPDDDAPIVAEICRRLDGIALAIELATARVGTFGIRGVAAELDDRFKLLSRGLRTAAPRHRTLNAVFEWSYQLLPPVAQRVFRRLSILAGGFTLEAAQAVASDYATSQIEVAESVGTLVAASLLTADLAGQMPSYRLLDSARAYGRERLHDSRELDQASRRHAEYFLDYFQRASLQSSGWSSRQWVETYKSQLDNLRDALDWSSSTQEWQLRNALTTVAVPLLTHLSLNEECRARLQAALTERPIGLVPDERCEMQLLAGLGMSLLYTRSGGSDANMVWQNCLAAAERNGDVDYQLRAIRGLWTSSFNKGDIQAVRRLGRHFEDMVKLSTSPEDSLLSRRMCGMEKFYRGRVREARDDLQIVFKGYSEATRGSDILRYQFDQTVMACVNLSKVMWLQGFPDQSTALAERSLDVARAVDHDLSFTYALAFASCRIAIVTGDFVSAESYIDQLYCRASVDRAGAWSYFGQCWKATLLSRQGNPVEAAEMLADALLGVPEGSFGMHHTRFLGELALALARAGDVGGGLTNIRRAIVICERLDERWFLAELLRLEGEILSIEGGASAAQSRHRFMQAIELAEHQGALSLELRAASSLVRLGVSDGSGKNLRMLQDVYGRFVEGFGTIDLTTAKNLLDGCSNP